MAKKKTLTITITDTEEGTITNLKAKRLSDFEIIGMLSYYLDACKIRILKSPGGVEPIETEEIEEDGSEA